MPQHDPSANQRRVLPDAARRNQFRFLVADEPECYWTVVEFLAERRWLGELEVDYDDLRAGTETGRDLRALLVQLEGWGNLTQRLEPRRIRTLEDRSVERYKVKIEDETAEIVEFLTQNSALNGEVDAELAQDRLRGLEACLRDLTSLLADRTSADPDRLPSAASCLRKARSEAASADKDLHEFAQLIRKQASSGRPSGRDIAQFLDGLQRYVDRYLGVLSEVRGRCWGYLEKLRSEEMQQDREMLQSFLASQSEEAAMAGIRSRRCPDVVEVLLTLSGFFDSGGELDRRCGDVQLASLELVRCLRRHLEQVLLRSRHRALLKSASDRLLRTDTDLSGQTIARFFDELWMVVNPHHIEGQGTPSDREEVGLPLAAARRSQRAIVAYVSPAARPSGVARSLAEREFEVLNEFVHGVVLRGEAEGELSSGMIHRHSDLHLLFRAIRAGRDSRSPMARRILKFRVELPTQETPLVVIRVPGGALTAPRMRFLWKATDVR